MSEGYPVGEVLDDKIAALLGIADGGVSARHSSATAEHYTPAYIVEAARATLGGIDLDPFSCAKANETVGAASFWTLNDDGPESWNRPWHGRVFCNPPGGKDLANQSRQKLAWFKLAEEYSAGRVTSAVFVCFSVELLQTTQSKTPPGLALPLDFPICYPSKRVAYVREDGVVGGSPPHSSCIIFLPGEGCLHPCHTAAFAEHFGPIGKVVIPS